MTFPQTDEGVFLQRPFHNPSQFRKTTGTEYSLLPFRFIDLDVDRYLITNFSGEYLLLNETQLNALVRHELGSEDSIYDDLKSKHFLVDGDSTAAIDLLACQYRTKHSQLSQLTSLFMFVVTLRCEHSCPYCQVSRQSQDKSRYDMSQSDAGRAIEFLFHSPSRQIKVEFQGGGAPSQFLPHSVDR
ncbi:MAG: hypothetical protein KDA85_15660 [Planctomycetaceae bacterium]|nr:hypothetical protein [Planctomycetaceae bacterium]